MTYKLNLYALNHDNSSTDLLLSFIRFNAICQLNTPTSSGNVRFLYSKFVLCDLWKWIASAHKRVAPPLAPVVTSTHSSSLSIRQSWTIDITPMWHTQTRERRPLNPI